MVSALVGNVETGSRTANDAGALMSRIVEEANHVAEPIPEITRAPTEQSVGVTQINASVTLIDQCTQQNTPLVEQTAAAAKNLKSQAEMLAKAVSVFGLLESTVVEGASAADFNRLAGHGIGNPPFIHYISNPDCS